MTHEDKNVLAEKLRDYVLERRLPNMPAENRYKEYVENKRVYHEVQDILVAIFGHIGVLEQLGYVVVQNEKKALRNQIKTIIMAMPISMN